MRVIFNNKEGKEITLADYNFIKLKDRYNVVEMTPRRIGIAQREILARKLKIEVITDKEKIKAILEPKETKDGSKGKNKGKEEHQEFHDVIGYE